MMKKMIMFLLIGFVLLINGEVLKSEPTIQCPFGYVQLTKFVSVNVGGMICQYKVYICVKCNAGPTPQPFIVELAAFVADPIDCGQNATAVKDAIVAIITDPDWIEANISDECFSGFGPCENQTPYVTLTSRIPICWTTDNFEGKTFYVACEPYCGCCQDYWVCWNGTNVDKYTIGDPYIDGGENCETCTGSCFHLGTTPCD